MVARVETVAFLGIEVKPIDVQVHITNGMPAFTMVGLPDKAVGESRERVRAALSAMGLALPPKRVTINLSPADVTKEGGHYDLPVALGLLAALGAVPQDALDRFVALGELALDGGPLHRLRVSCRPPSVQLPEGAASSAHRIRAAKHSGPGMSMCWPRPTCWRWSIISAVPSVSVRRDGENDHLNRSIRT